jgi:hypothetical protein
MVGSAAVASPRSCRSLRLVVPRLRRGRKNDIMNFVVVVVVVLVLFMSLVLVQ